MMRQSLRTSTPCSVSRPMRRMLTCFTDGMRSTAPISSSSGKKTSLYSQTIHHRSARTPLDT